MGDIDTMREYVKHNRDDLAHIVRFSDDTYLRAVAAALLTEGGEDPDIEQVKRELELALEVLGDDVSRN